MRSVIKEWKVKITTIRTERIVGFCFVLYKYFWTQVQSEICWQCSKSVVYNQEAFSELGPKEEARRLQRSPPYGVKGNLEALQETQRALVLC